MPISVIINNINLKLNFMDFTSPMHIVLILAIVLLLFGGKKIPELMKGIGQGMKEFKKASQYDPEEDKKTDAKTDAKTDTKDVAKKE